MINKKIKDIIKKNDTLIQDISNFLSQKLEEGSFKRSESEQINRNLKTINEKQELFIIEFQQLQKLLFNNISSIQKFMFGIKEPLDIYMMSQENTLNLSKRGVEIEEIVQTVAKIADNTNLLSLNAAIEAAQAGKHGKGFSILAGVIRKLARKIEKLTRDIRGLTNEVQFGLKQILDYFNDASAHSKDITSMGNEIEEDFNHFDNNITYSNELFNNMILAFKEYEDYIFTIYEYIDPESSNIKETKINVTGWHFILQDENDEIKGLLPDQGKISAKNIKELKKIQKNLFVSSEELLNKTKIRKNIEESLEQKIEKKHEKTQKIEDRFSQSNTLMSNSIVELNDIYGKNRELLESMIMKISDITNNTDSANIKIKKLNEFIGKINRLVDEVTYITIQITLLSVNGAIESANAGDAGKGFATVSSDVQELAEASSEHAAKIKDMLCDIQGELIKIYENVNQGLIIAKQQTSEIILAAPKLDKATLDIATIISQVNEFKHEFKKVIKKKVSSEETYQICKRESNIWFDEITSIKSKAQNCMSLSEKLNIKISEKNKIKTKPKTKRQKVSK